MSVVLLEHDEKVSGQPGTACGRSASVLHYETLGRGRPVVFLHTWVGSWRYWISSMQALASGWRSYALDLWGYGSSARDPGLYDRNGNTGLLDGFLTAMGMDRVSLVGHGLGAAVAVEFARQHPGTVERLALVGCPVGNLHASDRLWSIPPADLAAWLAAGRDEKNGLQDHLVADPAPVEANRRWVREAGGIPWRSWLSQPCLLVEGALDPSVRSFTAEDSQGWPEMAGWVKLDGCGHFPMLDDNDRFNRLLVEFLTLPEGESPQALQVKDGWKRRVR